MPRIDAPSVRENRENREALLRQATRAMLIAGGPEAVSMTDAAHASGISRSTAYEYFPSTTDLVAAVVVDDLRAWAQQVVRATEASASPDEAVSTFVQTSVHHLARTRAHAVLTTGLTWTPIHSRPDVEDAFEEALSPLRIAMGALGASEVRLATRLALAVIAEAARATELAPRAAAAAASEFILAAARGPTAGRSPRRSLS